jgi:hypothetical protein
MGTHVHQSFRNQKIDLKTKSYQTPNMMGRLYAYNKKEV